LLAELDQRGGAEKAAHDLSTDAVPHHV